MNAATPPPLFGLVLAGGRSTRMQRDKAAIEYRPGETQLDAAMKLLAPAWRAASFPCARNSAPTRRAPLAADLRSRRSRGPHRRHRIFGPSYTASGLADLALYEGRISEAVRILTQGAAAESGGRGIASARPKKSLRSPMPSSSAAEPAAVAERQGTGKQLGDD